MNIVIIVLALVFVAVLTYFVLAKIVAPFSTLHRGATLIESQYPGILAWPPTYELINTTSILKLLSNYSLVYGPNTAPIKIAILFNPLIPPGSNFTISNVNYILSTSSSGSVQYYILFNVLSFSAPGYSSSPLTIAEINVASITYCIYNTINRTAALEFLNDVSNYVSANETLVTNLTSTSFLQQFLTAHGFNVNTTTCISNYESRVMSYQSYIGLILNAYYVPTYVIPTETGQIPVNAPVLFIIGYNNVTQSAADSLNNVDLPLFIHNLETQEFMYNYHLGG